MCPILSYQNIATLTPVYQVVMELPDFLKMNCKFEFEIKHSLEHSCIHVIQLITHTKKWRFFGISAENVFY